MLDTKLIVLDGLSGSGKSTFCQWLELQLRRNGRSVRWLHEGDIDHPLHWWDFWDGHNYYPPDFEGVAISQFIETSLQKWRSFVAAAHKLEIIYVAESVFLLLAVGRLLHGEVTHAELLNYGRRVQDIAQGLNPHLIYLRQGDIALQHRKTWDFRGQEIENELVMNMERTPYFKCKKLKGVEGIMVLWEETQQLHDQLFTDYTIPKLAIDISAGEWENYRQQILDFLVLPQVTDEEVVSQRELEKLTGRYRSGQGETGESATVELKENHLVVQLPGASSYRLIPIDSLSFYAGVSPITVTFRQNEGGIIQEMAMDSTRLGGGEVKIWGRR